MAPRALDGELRRLRAMSAPPRRTGSRLAAVFLLLALLVPGPVAAHAALDVATPAAGATVTGPPEEVSGMFTQDMDPAGSSIEIRDGAGTVIAAGGVDPANARRMVIADLPSLAAGEYEVRWTTLSSEDGELDRDTWTFTVSAPPTDPRTPTPEPTPEPTASATASATQPSSSVPASDEPSSPEPASPEPASPETSPSPLISPAGGEDSPSAMDAALPIVIALIVVGGAALYLLTRRRPRSSG